MGAIDTSFFTCVQMSQMERDGGVGSGGGGVKAGVLLNTPGGYIISRNETMLFI